MFFDGCGFRHFSVSSGLTWKLTVTAGEKSWPLRIGPLVDRGLPLGRGTVGLRGRLLRRRDDRQSVPVAQDPTSTQPHIGHLRYVENLSA